MRRVDRQSRTGLIYLLTVLSHAYALGGPASDPGRLSSNDVSVDVTVLASNNPHGVYVFANGSQHVSVAEDSVGQSLDVTTSLLVERTPGAADHSQVIFLSDHRCS